MSKIKKLFPLSMVVLGLVFVISISVILPALTDAIDQVRVSIASRLQHGSAYIKYNGTSWAASPGLTAGTMVGTNGMYFDFSNEGQVQAKDNGGNPAYIQYKQCYASASYSQSSGSSSSSTIHANVEDTYYPVKDLTIRQQSGAGYVTYVDNDSDNEGFKFVVGQYGAGLYDITAIVTVGASVSDAVINGAIYVNNVRVAESEAQCQAYLSKDEMTPSCQYPLVAGDKVAFKIAQTQGAGVTIPIRQAKFKMNRISR